MLTLLLIIIIITFRSSVWLTQNKYTRTYIHTMLFIPTNTIYNHARNTNIFTCIQEYYYIIFHVI